jgi:hypothetical protein
LRGLAGQIQALVEGRRDEAGAAGDYARQAGDKVNQLAGRLEQGGFDGLVDDVRRFARQRPGLFLVGAAAAGFAAGRMIRASRGGDDGESFAGDGPSGPYRFAGNDLGPGAGSDYLGSTELAAGTPYAAAMPAAGPADDDVLLADTGLGTAAPGSRPTGGPGGSLS